MCISPQELDVWIQLLVRLWNHTQCGAGFLWGQFSSQKLNPWRLRKETRPKLREPTVGKDVASFSSPWHSSSTKRLWTEGQITVTQMLSKYHVTNHHINLYPNQPKLGLKIVQSWQSKSLKTFQSPKQPLNGIHDHCYKSPRLQGSNPQPNKRSNVKQRCL